MTVDEVDASLLDDRAEIHHDEIVGDLAHDREIVRDEQVGHVPLSLQVPEQVEHAGLDAHVEGRDGLIEDDRARLERQCPGDADPLALAARELRREAHACSAGRG